MLGQTLGHYRIETRLGAGGMGVVYLAHDTRLDRPVALKLLGDPSLLDPVARGQLLREGRAASALNHPNICTVHEVEEIEGQTFIVMEYVEGSALSTMLPTDGLPVELVLRYAAQIADALEHAHERGVIHADLKSANVMVTREGRVKVLDFGLARRALNQVRQETAQPTVSREPHAVLAGTLSYMAPEILMGEPPEASSDIWSLGVLLYEIASGELPFRGSTAFDLSAAIQRDPAAPLPAHVPPAVRAIILRCLAKESRQRYRRAGEVRAALEAVESSVQIALPQPDIAGAQHRWRWAAVGALALGVAALAVVLWRKPSVPIKPARDGGGRLTLLISSERRAFDPALSPDGRMIAYVAEAPDGQIDLFVGDARGEGRVRLTEDAAREAQPRFSPDGTHLAFARLRPETMTSEICVIPALGGQVIPIVPRAENPAWSPDGMRLAFLHRPSPGEPVVLATANADGSDMRSLFPADGAFPFMRAPAWSPDGKEIAFIRGTGGVAGQLWIIPSAGGSPRRLSNDPAAVFSEGPVFTPEGDAIVHTSNRGGATNIWLFPRNSGAPVRLTTGSGPDASPSVARDGTIAFSNSRWRNVLLVHAPVTGATRTLVTHSSYLWGPAFSPNGRELAYSQGEVDGSWHLWVVPTGGGTPRRVTSTPQGEIYPRYTPDGSFIIYHNWNEPRRIWRAPRAGGPPTLLPIVQGADDGYADVSPDGVWVAFRRVEAQAEHLYVAAMAGGAARRLIDGPGSVPRWSPDSRWIAFSSDRGYTSGVFVVRRDGTGQRRVTERGGWPIWWPDGKQIAYRAIGQDGNQIVEVVPFEGGAARRLQGLRFNGTNEPIAVSPDGALIATTDALHVSDEIWLLRPQ